MRIYMTSEMVETVSHTQDRDEVKEGAWVSVKKHPKVILYSVAACVSSMLWGFDIGMSVPSRASRNTISDSDSFYNFRS